MPHLPIGTARLYYESHGEGPAVVFAHGLGGSHLSWWQQVPFFREKFRTITFAHRSFHPSSDPEGIGPKAYVDDLRALFDHLRVDDVRLVGQSIGGHTVMDFAIREPGRVKALVLSGSDGAYEYPDLARVWPGIAAAVEDCQGRAVHPAAGPRMSKEQPALHFLYEQIAELAATDETRAAVRRGYDDMPVASVEALARLTMPVCCIRGEEDPLFPREILDALVAALPTARKAIIPKSGHSPYFERATEWNQTVEAFLAPTVS